MTVNILSSLTNSRYCPAVILVMCPHSHIRSFTAGMLFLMACHPSAIDHPEHSLEIHVYHHLDPVANTSVWLKENANDFPGWNTRDYDFHGVSNTSGVLILDGLLPGTHYLLGLGHDGADSVKGYQSVVISANDADHYKKVILQVTE